MVTARGGSSEAVEGVVTTVAPASLLNTSQAGRWEGRRGSSDKLPLGLQLAYTYDNATFNYLPEGEIPLMFERLENQATTPQVCTVTDYILRTWINNSVWPPST